MKTAKNNKPKQKETVNFSKAMTVIVLVMVFFVSVFYFNGTKNKITGNVIGNKVSGMEAAQQNQYTSIAIKDNQNKEVTIYQSTSNKNFYSDTGLTKELIPAPGKTDKGEDVVYLKGENFFGISYDTKTNSQYFPTKEGTSTTSTTAPQVSNFQIITKPDGSTYAYDIDNNKAMPEFTIININQKYYSDGKNIYDNQGNDMGDVYTTDATKQPTDYMWKTKDNKNVETTHYKINGKEGTAETKDGKTKVTLGGEEYDIQKDGTFHRTEGEGDTTKEYYLIPGVSGEQESTTKPELIYLDTKTKTTAGYVVSREERTGDKKETNYYLIGSDGKQIISGVDGKIYGVYDDKGKLTAYSFYNKEDTNDVIFSSTVDNTGKITETYGKWTVATAAGLQTLVGTQNYYFAEYEIKNGKPIIKGDAKEFDSCTKLGTKTVCKGMDGKTIYDCSNPIECAKGTAKTIEDKEFKDILGVGGYGWTWLGNMLDDMQQATSGYSGISMFYSEPDPIIGLDETMAGLLGGIEGWTSLICKEKASNAEQYGAAFSQFFEEGAYAYIQGARLEAINYSSSTPTTSYIYKISFQVSPGSEYRGCDMKFSVYIKNGKSKPLIVDKDGSAYVFDLKQGDSEVKYIQEKMIFAQSSNKYTKACIKFSSIEPELITLRDGTAAPCLIGIEEGDELCSDLIKAGPQRIDIQNPCDEVGLSFFVPTCWGATGGGEVTGKGEAVTGTGTSGGSTEGKPSVNTNI